ncbi:MAG: hypothetical protein AAF581_12305 [Planctomycetota bacterium]
MAHSKSRKPAARYRLRVGGYLLLWLLEGVGQCGSLLWFLIRQRRVRTYYHDLIAASATAAR